MENTDDKSRHQIGLLEATSYVVGQVIGAGIFLTPTTILKHSGSVGVSLLIWLAGGVISLVRALFMMELGTSIRESGADYAYVRYVGWRPLAFALVWVWFFVSNPFYAALLMALFGEYLVKPLEHAGWVCDPVAIAILQRLAGYLLMCLLLFINMHSLKRFAGVFQVVVTVAKLFALTTIIVTGFYFLIFRGWTQNFEDIFGGSTITVRGLIFSINSSIFAYAGFEVVNAGVEAIRKPRRTLPMSILTGSAIVTALYLTTNVAYFTVLGKADMLSSLAVAETFSQRVLSWGSFALPLVICIVFCGSMNADIFGSSRICFSAARRNNLPSCFSVVHEASDSPRAAVFAHGFLAILSSFAAKPEQLLQYSTYVGLLSTFIVSLVLLWIRIKRVPVHEGAIRMPMWLLIAAVLLNAALCLVPLYSAPDIALIGCVGFLIGLAMYFLVFRFDFLVDGLKLRALNDKVAEWSQKLFDATRSHPPPDARSLQQKVAPIATVSEKVD